MKEYFKSIFFLYVALQYGTILLKFFVMKSDNNILGVLLMLLFHSIYFVIDFLSYTEIIDCNPYIIATDQLILIILTVIFGFIEISLYSRAEIKGSTTVPNITLPILSV